MKTILTASIILLSFNVFAAECQGPVVVPSYNCITPDGKTDLRFSVMEFQTCEDGKITELDRYVSLMKFDGSQIIMVPEEEIQVKFEAERRYYDRAHRVDDLTFIHPTSVTAEYQGLRIELDLPNKLVPIYRGSLERHMPGTFKLSKAGRSVTGKLSCSIFN